MSIRDTPFSGGDFMRFIGRAFELRELEEEYEKGTFALSVIYGRRRVGKTYLIKEFLKRKKGYYFGAAFEYSKVFPFSKSSCPCF